MIKGEFRLFENLEREDQFCYKFQKTKAGDVLPGTAQLEADLLCIMCRCEGECEGFLTLHLSFI